MARNRNFFKRRVSWKQIICFVIGTLLVLGCAFGAVALFGKDTKSISPGAFSIGGLDEQGEYVARKNALFTEDLIECQGLEITPDIKCESTYRIYLYDHNKELIEATDMLAGNYKLTNTAVQYCRIMIVPAAAEEDEDFEITFLNKWTYASQLDIRVNRKQNFEVVNYFEAEKIDKVASYNAETNVLEYVEKDGYGASKLADIEGVAALKVVFESAQPKALDLLFYKESVAEGATVYEYVSTETTATTSTEATVTVPEGATHMVVNYVLTEDFAIYSAN